jgi:hypothetical protein
MRLGLRIMTGVLVSASGALPSAVLADPPRFDVTAMVGYRAGGEFEDVDPESTTNNTLDLDDGTSIGIDLGLYRDTESFYEILYSRQESGIDSPDPVVGSVDVATEYSSLAARCSFRMNTGSCRLSLTIGATRLDPNGGFDSETDFSASLGGGVRLPFNERIAANIGVRGYVTLVDSDTAIFCVGSGDLNCLVRTSGSTFFQGEAFLGLSFRF